jgi:hypothetical protein
MPVVDGILDELDDILSKDGVQNSRAVASSILSDQPIAAVRRAPAPLPSVDAVVAKAFENLRANVTPTAPGEITGGYQTGAMARRAAADSKSFNAGAPLGMESARQVDAVASGQLAGAFATSPAAAQQGVAGTRSIIERPKTASQISPLGLNDTAGINPHTGTRWGSLNQWDQFSPQTQQEIRAIASGTMPGYMAKSPNALAFAQEAAKWGVKLYNPRQQRVQPDPQRVAAAQAQLAAASSGTATAATPTMTSAQRVQRRDAPRSRAKARPAQKIVGNYGQGQEALLAEQRAAGEAAMRGGETGPRTRQPTLSDLDMIEQPPLLMDDKGNPSLTADGRQQYAQESPADRVARWRRARQLWGQIWDDGEMSTIVDTENAPLAQAETIEPEGAPAQPASSRGTDGTVLEGVGDPMDDVPQDMLERVISEVLADRRFAGLSDEEIHREVARRLQQ